MYFLDSLRSSFLKAADTFPDLRLSVCFGEPADMSRFKQFVEEKLMGNYDMCAGRPIAWSVELNNKWRFYLNGDDHSAQRFLDLSAEAGGLLSDQPNLRHPDFNPADFGAGDDRQFAWFAALFQMAWNSKKGTPGYARPCQIASNGRSVDVRFSVLPMNPFRASILLLDLVAARDNEPQRTRTTTGRPKGSVSKGGISAKVKELVKKHPDFPRKPFDFLERFRDQLPRRANNKNVGKALRDIKSDKN